MRPIVFVFRLGPPAPSPRLSVCYRTLRVAWAIERAVCERRGDGALYWIAQADAPAHRVDLAPPEPEL